jgi:hypothetical protein
VLGYLGLAAVNLCTEPAPSEDIWVHGTGAGGAPLTVHCGPRIR